LIIAKRSKRGLELNLARHFGEYGTDVSTAAKGGGELAIGKGTKPLEFGHYGRFVVGRAQDKFSEGFNHVVPHAVTDFIKAMKTPLRASVGFAATGMHAVRQCIRCIADQHHRGIAPAVADLPHDILACDEVIDQRCHERQGRDVIKIVIAPERLETACTLQADPNAKIIKESVG
jgi:hypothetical protein